MIFLLYNPCRIYPKDKKNQKEILNCTVFLLLAEMLALLFWNYNDYIIKKKKLGNYVNATRKQDFQAKEYKIKEISAL